MSDRIVDITPQLEAARRDRIRSRQHAAAVTAQRTLHNSEMLKVEMVYAATTPACPELPHQQIRDQIHDTLQQFSETDHPRDFAQFPCKTLSDMLYYSIATYNNELANSAIIISTPQVSLTFDYRNNQ